MLAPCTATARRQPLARASGAPAAGRARGAARTAEPQAVRQPASACRLAPQQHARRPRQAQRPRGRAAARCARAARARRRAAAGLPRCSAARHSSRAGAASSAAAVGVGARRSAARSARVTSVSWPTPHTTGSGQAAIARTTRSSLNAHRSSSEPPPRHDDQRIDLGAPVGQRNRRDQRRRRLGALHQARVDDQLDLRRAARERAQHVVQRRRAERGHDTDAPRDSAAAAACARRRTGPRPRASPSGAGTARTARRRRRAASPRRRTAVRRAARRRATRPRTSTCWPSAGAKSSRLAARRNIAQRSSAGCAVGVLQREVAVPAGGAREARDLAAHRAGAEARRQRIAGRQQQARRRPRPGAQSARRRGGSAIARTQRLARAENSTAAPIQASRGIAACHEAVMIVQVIDLQEKLSAQVLQQPVPAGAMSTVPRTASPTYPQSCPQIAWTVAGA